MMIKPRLYQIYITEQNEIVKVTGSDPKMGPVFSVTYDMVTRKKLTLTTEYL